MKILVIVAMLLAVPALASAQSNTFPRERITDNACDRVNTRIETIISRYNDQKDRHIKRYEEIYQKLSSVAAKHDGSQKLKADLQKLNDLTKRFASEYTRFVDELRASQQFTCGKSDGQFRAKVASSRAILKQAKYIAVSAKELIRTDIKNDLQELKP